MSRAVNKHEIFSSQQRPYELSKGRLMSRVVGQMKTSMGGSRAPSLTVTFISRRRHARGQHRVWMPLPQYPGLSQMANPIPYPPTSKLSSTSHNGSHPNGSPTSPHTPYLLHPSQPRWHQLLSWWHRPAWLALPYQHPLL